MKKSRGFTLIELMITLVILGIVLAIAMPSMSKFIVKQRVQSQVDELMITLAYARAEAVKNNTIVYVIPNGITTADWQKKGWCVLKSSGTTCAAADEHVLRVFDSKTKIETVTQYATGAAKLGFTAQGALVPVTPNDGFKIYSTELPESERNAILRCIKINPQGRAKVERYAPGQCEIS